MRPLNFIPPQTLVVLACDFALVSTIYLTCQAFIAGGGTVEYLLDQGGWLRVLLAVISVLGGLYFNELYAELTVRSRVALVLQLAHVLGVSLVVQTLLAYVSPELAVSRSVMLFGTVLVFPSILLWRIFYSGVLWKLFGRQTILLIGSGPLAQAIAREIARRPERGFRLAGYVGDPVAENILAAPYLGPFEEIETLTAEYRPNRLAVACSDRRDGGLPIEPLLNLRRRGILIEEGSSLYEMLSGRIYACEFRPAQFIFDQTMVHRPGSLAIQSIYINLLALAGIILLSPLMVILAFLVRFSTGGPILESTLCTGYRSIPFGLKKFRSTRAEAGHHRVRVTMLGAFLRRSRLDLLPVLFNLLRGEMALVGPRPSRLEFSADLSNRIPFYEQRYALKPGLTGWSQINMEERITPVDALRALEYDLYYLKNISLSLDAFILLHRLRQFFTIPV